MRHGRALVALTAAVFAAACGGMEQQDVEPLEDGGLLVPEEVIDPTWEPDAPVTEVEGVQWADEDVPEAWETPSPITDPILKPDITVIEPYLAKDFGIEPNRLVIPLAGNEELAVIRPGHKLISAYLFSRVVESVDRVGDELVFETRDALPTDVIERGSIRFPDGVVAGTYDPMTGEREWFDPRDDPFQRGWNPHWRLEVPEEPGHGPFGSVSQGAEGGLSVGGPSLKIERNVEGDVGRGFAVGSSGSLTVKPVADISFEPLFRVHMDIQSSWGRPYVEYFEMRGEGTVQWTLGVEVTGTRAVSGSFSLPILGQRTPTTTGRFPFHVGCVSTPTVWVSIVPIWADIFPKLSFDAQVELSGALQVNASVTGQRTIGGGLRYRDGQGWLAYRVNPNSTLQKNVTVSASFALAASAGITPKANINLWSLAGPYVSFPFGVEFESKCQPPQLTHELKAFLAGNVGVATDPQGAADWVVPKWQAQMQVFKATYPLPLPAALQNGACGPGYVQLDYRTVRANDNTSRFLELDVVVEVPREAGGGHVVVSNNSRLRTIPASAGSFPYAAFAAADAAGRSELLSIERAIPGDYKVWVYDYENSAVATNAFSRGQAKVVISSPTAREFTAPAGTYNRWNVATIRVDAQRRMTVIPCSSGCTQSVDLMP